MKNLVLVRFIDALNREVLDRLLLPAFIHSRVFASANGLVDVVVVHGCWIGFARVSIWG